MFFNTFAVACGLAAGASAHITMAFPSPFTAPAVTQSPISYANFPCQSTSTAAFAGPTNTVSLGAEVDLKFNGEAVHGGGSCQISITYDTEPTADSVWKVVKSFEGGCPARNTVGNLGDDTSATAPVPFDYNFTMPDNIPSGAGTMAWTWINKVGNREFYMNCAALELEGTGGDASNYDALPDMFVANLAGGPDTCSVGNGDFVYPAPGDVVEYGNGEKPSGETVATTGGVCTVGVSAGSGATGAAGATATATGAGSEATATPAAGGVFATASGAAPTAEPAVTSETTADPVVETTAAAATATGSSSSTTGSATTGACTTEGEMTCLGSTYQVCASGQWSVAMALAGGTECAGSGSSFKIAASSSKFRRSREDRRAAKAEKRGLGLML